MEEELDHLKEKINKILETHNFCDNGLLDSCVEELIELFEETLLDNLIEHEDR